MLAGAACIGCLHLFGRAWFLLNGIVAVTRYKRVMLGCCRLLILLRISYYLLVRSSSSRMSRNITTTDRRRGLNPEDTYYTGSSSMPPVSAVRAHISWQYQPDKLTVEQTRRNVYDTLMPAALLCFTDLLTWPARFLVFVLRIYNRRPDEVVPHHKRRAVALWLALILAILSCESVDF